MTMAGILINGGIQEHKGEHFQDNDERALFPPDDKRQHEQRQQQGNHVLSQPVQRKWFGKEVAREWFSWASCPLFRPLNQQYANQTPQGNHDQDKPYPKPKGGVLRRNIFDWAR